METVGRLARFIIADLTDTKAVDQELQSNIAERKVTIQPLLLAGVDRPTGMLEGVLQKPEETSFA